MHNAARSHQSQVTTKNRRSSAPAIAGGLNRSPHWSTVAQRAQAAPETLTPTDVLTLQRAIGNRATVGLLSRSPVLQAKLKLGPAGDKYEQEADRVAAQVTRQMERPHLMRHTDADKPSTSNSFARTQDCPLRKAEPLAKNFFTRSVQGKVAQPTSMHRAEGGKVESSVAQQIGAARGRGKPLDDSVRAKMERGFGADFSGVRVHTGGQADTLNRSLNARAFTTGQDIFFGKGQYNPGSQGGQQLIAHELTHTVQQGAVGEPVVQRALNGEQKERWQEAMSAGVSSVSQVIYQRQENNDKDPAEAELKRLLRATFLLAEAFMNEPVTTNNHLNLVQQLFSALASLAGLQSGGGYVRSGVYEKKHQKLKDSSFKNAAATKLFTHGEKVYRRDEEGESYLDDLVDPEDGAMKKGLKRAGYHAVGGLMNLAFPVSVLGLIGGLAPTKLRALSTRRTERTLRSDKNSVYQEPLTKFRDAINGIKEAAPGLSPVQGAGNRVLELLEKFLKKRKAQWEKVQDTDKEGTLAEQISTKWMTGKFLSGLVKPKTWGKK